MKRFVFSIAVLWLILPFCAYAAGLSLTASPSAVAVGDTVTLSLTVDSSGTAINAAEGTIAFPPDIFSFVSAQYSNSIFSLWIDSPAFNGNNAVVFNGGLPSPGYSGSSGTILTITLRAQKQGTADFSITGAAVRANDGLGTDVLTAMHGAHITVSPRVPSPSTIQIKPIIPLSKPSGVSSTTPSTAEAPAAASSTGVTTPTQNTTFSVISFVAGFFAGILLLTNFVLWYILVTSRRIILIKKPEDTTTNIEK